MVTKFPKKKRGLQVRVVKYHMSFTSDSVSRTGPKQDAFYKNKSTRTKTKATHRG